MRKRIFCILLGVALSFSLVSCGNKKVDYIPDESESTDEVATPGEKETDEANKYKWKESIKTKDIDGKEIEFMIDAVFSDDFSGVGITNEKFAVVYYEDFVCDEEYKKSVINNFFGTNRVYSLEDENLPRYDIEKKINEYESEISDKNISDDKRTELTELINRYKKLYSSAPADYVEISNYSGNCYLSFLDDIPYMISFPTGKDDNVSLVYKPYGKYDYYDDSVTGEATTNASKLETLKSNMKKIGLDGIYNVGDMEARGEDSLLIEFSNDNKEDLEYKTDKAEFVGSQLGRESFYNSKLVNYVDAAFLGDKIYKLEIYNPIRVRSIQENIKIMEIESIKSSIRGILENNGDKLKLNSNSGSGKLIKCSNIVLSLYEETDNEGNKAIVPAWNVGDYFWVNALDGKLINQT